MIATDEVSKASREFRNAAQDLLNADQNTYDSRVKALVYLIKNEPALCESLGEFLTKPLEMSNIEEHIHGWGKLSLPHIKSDRIAYGLQVLERFSLKENGAMIYAFTFFHKQNTNAALRKVNEQLFVPVFRDIYNILDEIQEKAEVVAADKQKNSTVGSSSVLSIKAEAPLGFRIINTRDTINAIFYNRHNKPIFSLRNERCIIELFKSARSQEEFTYRISSLATMIDHMNVDTLRNVVGEKDNQVKSIGLLDKYLTQIGSSKHDTSIRTLRSIAKLRQGYPIHGDQVAGMIEAHGFFGFEYPITNHEAAWITLLTKYLETLETILNAIKQGENVS